MFSLLVTLIVALIAGYLVVRFNGLWVYRLFDRALERPRSNLESRFELPRYFRVGPGGGADLEAKWPGWDGWYFFVAPEGNDIPVKMIRASIMTGLYGLDGIDDYSALPVGLSSSHAAEYLSMAPAVDQADGKIQRNNHLAHFYEPKQRLDLSLKELAVSMAAAAGNERCGAIQGKWPEYQFRFSDPTSGMECVLSYQGQDLVWWADIPGIFTYFAAFGRLMGKLTLRAGSAGPANPPAPPAVAYPIEGMGAFEHGFARKPFNFDFAYLPVRLLQKIAPGFRPIRYHYQLLVGEGGLHGGFMYARGFGIEFRNRGGIYIDGQYCELKRVKVEYLESEPGQKAAGSSRERLSFPKRWKVHASTEAGDLEFIAAREWPPAQVSSHMIYYNHSFEGTYLGKKIQGTGYGEYLNM